MATDLPLLGRPGPFFLGFRRMGDDIRTTGPRIKRMSDKGVSWLVELEVGPGGLKAKHLKAYRDSIGVPTIGPGLTYLVGNGGPRRVTMADRFDSQLAAMGQFALQLRRYEAMVDAATRDDITQAEFDAFTSLAYNCEAAMRGSTLVKLFNSRAPLSVILSELQRWNRAGGQISEGLIERRQCESDLIEYGCYRVQGERRAA